MMYFKKITTQELIADKCLEIGDGYRAKNSELAATGIPFIRAGDVNGTVRISGADYLSDASARIVGRKRSLPGDVVITTKGTIGRLAFVHHKSPEFIYSPQICFWRSLNQSVLDSRWLFFAMQSPFMRDQMAWSAAQTDMAPYISLIDQRTAFSLLLPPIEAQRSIASILGSLDDKIDLNRRTNETLEAMARALFRDWFVDFGPTRAKMAGESPYLAPELWELFPDKLDDEGKPEGWEVCNFDELVSINPKEKLSKNTIAPYLSMSELPTQGCLAEAPVPRPFSGGSKFRNGDTLLARITPCLENGKTALAQNLKSNIVGWGSTEFHVLRGKGDVPFSWVYLMARDNEFRTNAIRGMTGTSGRQRVASEVLATYKTVTPSSNQIWKVFDRACTPLFEKIIINGIESRTLSQFRNLLLPKLMSGEISIRDAEKMVEDAA